MDWGPPGSSVHRILEAIVKLCIIRKVPLEEQIIDIYIDLGEG